ncbi:hypothetical protein [Pantoea sp. R13S299]|uniref:hypothetical protein n=1 Tax=Pantoea sp. R13S299 TaxID=3402751 RepID=UPI003ADFF71F
MTKKVVVMKPNGIQIHHADDNATGIEVLIPGVLVLPIHEIEVDGDIRYYANGTGEKDEEAIREILRNN